MSLLRGHKPQTWPILEYLVGSHYLIPGPSSIWANSAHDSELMVSLYSSVPNFTVIGTLHGVAPAGWYCKFDQNFEFGPSYPPILTNQSQISQAREWTNNILLHAKLRIDGCIESPLGEGAKNLKFDRIFTFNIVWRRRLVTQRQSWTPVHNYKRSRVQSKPCSELKISNDLTATKHPQTLPFKSVTEKKHLTFSPRRWKLLCDGAQIGNFGEFFASCI